MGLGTIIIAAATLINSLLLLAYYLNNNAFPHPLSEKDEHFYLKKVQAGDLNARNTLIEHNLRLVAHIAKKFDGVGDDKDDIISIGTIGLIKAINTFDPEKGTKLATYAARCIENTIPSLWKHYFFSIGGCSFFPGVPPNKNISAFLPSQVTFSTILLIKVRFASTSTSSKFSAKEESIFFIMSKRSSFCSLASFDSCSFNSLSFMVAVCLSSSSIRLIMYLAASDSCS